MTACVKGEGAVNTVVFEHRPTSTYTYVMSPVYDHSGSSGELVNEAMGSGVDGVLSSLAARLGASSSGTVVSFPRATVKVGVPTLSHTSIYYVATARNAQLASLPSNSISTATPGSNIERGIARSTSDPTTKDTRGKKESRALSN